MSLTARPPRPRNTPGGDVVAGGTVASLIVVRPTTPIQWKEWQRRRNDHRQALVRWAAQRAKADPFGFHPRRELRLQLRALGLTQADDKRMMSERQPASRSRRPTGRALAQYEKGKARWPS
jgi:hypothetical protein